MCAQPLQDKAKQLQSLIDIPWGQTDCLRLAITAQAVLFNKRLKIKESMRWSCNTLQKRSHKIEEAIGQYAVEISEPEVGAVCLIHSLGFIHLATFIDIEHILTIRKDGRSEIVRYSEAYQRMTKKIYRWWVNKWL